MAYLLGTNVNLLSSTIAGPHTRQLLSEQCILLCILLWIFYVDYSTLLHLPPLRFHCVGGYWDRTHDCCDFTIDSQTLLPIG
jgi:hypothetical protein